MSHVNDPITYNHGLLGTSMIRLYPHQTQQPGIILYTDGRPSFMVCLSGSRECSPWVPSLCVGGCPQSTVLNISSGGSSDHIRNNYCVLDSDACFYMLYNFCEAGMIYPQFTNNELSSVMLSNLLTLTVGNKAGISIGVGHSTLFPLVHIAFQGLNIFLQSTYTNSPQINATVRCVQFSPQTVEVWNFLNWGFHKIWTVNEMSDLGRLEPTNPFGKRVWELRLPCQRPVISVWVTPSCFP